MKENIVIGILLIIVFCGSALFYRCLVAWCTVLAYKDASVIRTRRQTRKDRDLEMQSITAEAGAAA